jgi:hypothetical protein
VYASLPHPHCSSAAPVVPTGAPQLWVVLRWAVPAELYRRFCFFDVAAGAEFAAAAAVTCACHSADTAARCKYAFCLKFSDYVHTAPQASTATKENEAVFNNGVEWHVLCQGWKWVFGKLQQVDSLQQ